MMSYMINRAQLVPQNPAHIVMGSAEILDNTICSAYRYSIEKYFIDTRNYVGHDVKIHSGLKKKRGFCAFEFFNKDFTLIYSV